jgi:hypothetical protein
MGEMSENLSLNCHPIGIVLLKFLIWTIFLSQTVKKLSMSLKAIKNTKMTINLSIRQKYPYKLKKVKERKLLFYFFL